MNSINTDKFSAKLREKAIDTDRKAILITNFYGSSQENDFTKPPNCNGFGRVRHFRLDAGKDWIPNPLPILPAAKALGVKADSVIRAQVFQSSICNWRCWYCFVDFKLLSGNSNYASLLTCDEMIDLYLDQDDPPPMLDLTGGQPDLTPEWVPWMMKTLQERGLEDKVFLWSDDNLSNDYLWRFLDDEQISLMSSYKMYSRVCCFKGIDEKSFSLNTKADPKLFSNQLELCKRLLEINLDLYCYITLVATTDTDFHMVIPKFIDKVQKVNEMLPLRILPLRIFKYSTMNPRMTSDFENMIEGQHRALDVWQSELVKRFSSEQISLPITEIKLKN
ncbi:MAG: radical SAM protein [Ignavibacteriae bacterium]|nr:radical SAM protein [Ignavibacteriota bacterium]